MGMIRGLHGTLREQEQKETHQFSPSDGKDKLSGAEQSDSMKVEGTRVYDTLSSRLMMPITFLRENNIGTSYTIEVYKKTSER